MFTAERSIRSYTFGGVNKFERTTSSSQLQNIGYIPPCEVNRVNPSESCRQQHIRYIAPCRVNQLEMANTQQE